MTLWHIKRSVLRFSYYYLLILSLFRYSKFVACACVQSINFRKIQKWFGAFCTSTMKLIRVPKHRYGEAFASVSFVPTVSLLLVWNQWQVINLTQFFNEFCLQSYQPDYYFKTTSIFFFAKWYWYPSYMTNNGEIILSSVPSQEMAKS